MRYLAYTVANLASETMVLFGSFQKPHHKLGIINNFQARMPLKVLIKLRVQRQGFGNAVMQLYT